MSPQPPYRRKAARGITEHPSRHCPLTRHTNRRCDCKPTYIARLKHNTRTHTAAFTTLAEAAGWLEQNRRHLKTGVPVQAGQPQPAPSLGDLAISFLNKAQTG